MENANGFMKVSDFILEFIEKLGVKHVFYLPGGGAMHLNDSLGKNEKLEAISMLHEQACAIAAEAYARISEGYGVCLVTSGPGGTNAITGLAGAYLDSVPVIFISGQVKRADRVNGQGIRQFGIQEIDIVSIVKPLTKYAVEIKEAGDIRYELEKAAYIAREGRPGPVWIDVPLDIQAESVKPEFLSSYSREKRIYSVFPEQIRQIIELMNQAKCPVLILGNGIRSSGAVKEARMLCEMLGFPVLLTWNGVDLLDEDHPLYFGRPGAVGHRHANFIQQNADFVLTIGTRLNLLSTGFNYDSFLKKAKHVMVDIDMSEMKKCSVHPILKIQSDAKIFIKAISEQREKIDVTPRKEWLKRCKIWKKKYSVFLAEQKPHDGYVNTYSLIHAISRRMRSEDIYQFTSSGTAADIAMQVFQIKRGQRAFLSKGLAAMGYDLPACIGSCIASGGKRTICVTGDGGFMMNVQELATLKRLNLPIKIFIADNRGYGMIYGSQNGNFQGRLTGCTEESGLWIPEIPRIVESFGINGEWIENETNLEEKVQNILDKSGPVVCSVKVDIAQKILPRQTNYMLSNGQMASRPLEDMSPLLDREEFERNLL